MAEEKKSSFLDRFKKPASDGDGESSNSGSGSGFAAKFGNKKPAESTASLRERFEENKTTAMPFSEQKNVQRSKADGSYSDKVKKRGDLVYLVRGKDRGMAAWHYVLVDKMKKELFLAAARSGSLDVADYGKVLYSGWGQDPPPDIKKKIDDEYN